MPTLYIRRRETGDGVRYDVKYRRGGRYTPVEHAGSFRTQREAKLRLAFVGDMLAAGKDPKRELAALLERGRSFADVHAEWLASRRGVTEGTLDGYRHRGKRILEVFGERGVDDISVRDVIAWVQALADGKKPGTVRLYVGQVRQVLDFAGVAMNVARDRRVELPRRVTEEVRPPSAADVLRILNGADERFRLCLVTMEQTGARVSETLRLQPEDVDVAGCRVRVPRESAKGQRRGRMIDAPSFLVGPLHAGLPFRGLTRDSVRVAMRPYGFSPHDLRHRRASLWHQQGVVAVELARRLGNTAAVALGTYSHVMPLDEVDHALLSAFLR